MRRSVSVDEINSGIETNHMTHTSPAAIQDASMTCKEVSEFLMAYLDGELPEALLAAFDEHLSECSSCTRYLAQYRRTVQLGREALAPTDALASQHVPGGLLDAIKKARIDAGIGAE
jgi:anti-sigma factor RsiW